MILLIDTCGAQGNVGLAMMVDGTATMLREATIAGKTSAAELVPAIALLLKQAGMRLADLDAVAVVHGPGSFTGVRIGVSAAKGLVDAAGLPLIAISRLEVLVRQTSLPGDTIAALDAGRGEFYVGIYEGSQCVRESLMSRDAVVAVAAGGVYEVVVCEEGPRAVLAELNPEMRRLPSLGDVLLIAFERMVSARFDDVVTLDGNYLRRSDAEIFAKEGHAAKNNVAPGKPAIHEPVG